MPDREKPLEENPAAEKPEKKKLKKESELEKLQAELEETKDRHMRTLAEYDNFRKRSNKELEKNFLDSKAVRRLPQGKYAPYFHVQFSVNKSTFHCFCAKLKWLPYSFLAS